MGSPNESEVIVNGIQTMVLLDTGSSVSTVSETFYKSNLSDLTMQPLELILKIEGADGQHLPYLGYIEIKLQSNGANGIKHPCLLLVVPDSTYNLNVPLLLGTNGLSTFMEECRHRHGSRLLKVTDIHNPWYLAFRCMLMQGKELSRQQFSLGKVRSASLKLIIIPENSEMILKGYVDKPVAYRSTCALLQTHKRFNNTRGFRHCSSHS